ncbi:COG1361 family protein [Conexibacter woesei]|uniref:hypothetical protein n=1 Tax=Conexibacter woesei TaxID=191495 RepID=UPI0011D260BA|nr:hypothetical protein [Conexibacter woesei]
MPGRDVILRGGTAALAAAALVVAGCGGERQDANEKDATYRVSVVGAEFPARQQLAEETEMRIVVKNVDDRTIPNLAATIEAAGEGTETVAFGMLTDQPGVSSRSRPVWVVDDGPLSGDTAYANTWALGPLEPGDEQTFSWRVAAVVPGRYDVTYRLAGGLGGEAKVEQADGKPAAGRFTVDISRKPRQARIAADGTIVREPAR